MPLQRSGSGPSSGPPAIKKLPDFFIIGAPKCGTTAMGDYLSRHPDIFMARKEMHYFGGDLHFGSQIYRRDEKAYFAEFDGWNGQLLAGEASVWYLYSTQAAEEIKTLNPDARIVIMLREPTEMLYSLYYQFLLDGNEHLPTFEDAWSAQEDRQAGRRVTRNTYFRQGLFYRQVAAYTEQVRRYYDVFGRERVHVVFYDDFSANPGESFGALLRFLGAGAAPAARSFPVINPSQSVKSPLLRKVMSDPWVRGTAIAMNSWLPRPFFSAMQKIETRLMVMNIRPTKRPQLDPGVRLRLRREFAPEVLRLSELLGRDLTHWSRGEAADGPKGPPAAPQAKPESLGETEPGRPSAGDDAYARLTACANP